MILGAIAEAGGALLVISCLIVWVELLWFMFLFVLSDFELLLFGIKNKLRPKREPFNVDRWSDWYWTPKLFWRQSFCYRKKHIWIRESTNCDIRFCFQNSRVKINKNSKTTYADWCKKYKIKFCDKEIPKGWMTKWWKVEKHT